jgi:hypothetical protein
VWNRTWEWGVGGEKEKDAARRHLAAMQDSPPLGERGEEKEGMRGQGGEGKRVQNKRQQEAFLGEAPLPDITSLS